MTELHAHGRNARWPVIACTLILAFVTAGSAFASDYWVDPVNGSDASGQGTSASPWKTITHAVTQITPPPAPASDTLHLRPGLFETASGETFPITVPPGITLVGVDNGQSIVYGDNTAGVALIRFVGAHDARSGLRELGFSGGDPAVEIATNATTGPLIEDCRFQWNDVALVVSGANGTAQPTVRATEFSNQQQNAIRLVGGAGGCVGGSITACRVDFNTLDGLEIDGTLGDVCTQIANTTFIGNQRDGISYRGGTTSTAVITHCTVRASANAGLNVQAGSETNGLAIRNTICYGNTTFDFDNVQATNVRHCCFWTARGSAAPTSGQNGNLRANPRFVQFGDPDVRSDSPVIDRGDPTGVGEPRDDLHGDLRTIDGDGDATHVPDIGADEFTPLWISGLGPLPGGTTSFHVDLPTNTNIAYQIGLAFSAGGIPVAGQRTIPLWPDPLLALVVTGRLPILRNFAGQMNAVGFATGRITFPNDPRLRGVGFHAAAVTVQSGYPGGLRCVTNGLALTIQ